MHIKRIFIYVTLMALSVSTFNTPAFAVDTNFYRQNDILFYDPENTCVSSFTPGSASNKDYAGNDILNSAQLKVVSENVSFYKIAADKEGIPWQIIAAIHYRETRLKRFGPSNYQGPYQIISGGYPTGDYTDQQFQDATNKAAAFIKNKAGDTDLQSIDGVKSVLFAYNGKSDGYIQQALNLGFTKDQAYNGEGSAYVMNRADLKRDPTVEPTKSNNTWGQTKAGTIEYPANNDYGAFIVYASLSGLTASGDCGSNGLVSGGMTLKQALAFMETYRKSADSVKYVGAASQKCSGGPLANCVSFTAYFVNKYTDITDLKSGAIGNGIDVVSNLLSENSKLQGGTQPKPYAVFSAPSTTVWGHTGIILGVDTEKDVVVVGEAGCGLPLSWAIAREYSLSKFSDGSHTYAYTDGHLKGI